MALGELLAGMQRRLGQLVQFSQRHNPFDRTANYRDPLQAGAGVKYDFASQRSQITIGYGRVTEAVPFRGWYRVQTENAGPSVACCSMSQAGGGAAGGPRQGPSWVPGDAVFYLRHPGAPYGFILGSAPSQSWTPDQFQADFVTQASRGGYAVDAAHNHLLTLGDFAFREFTAGGPLDALAAGEVGQFFPTGPAWFMDAFMAFLRADENCGLWLFHPDQLARLHGHNLHLWSFAGAREEFDDEDELGLAESFSTYGYEALGFFAEPGGDTYREFTAEELVEKPHYGHREPRFDDQVPFRRWAEYGGYLGQGRRRHLCLPPAEGINCRTSEPPDLPGVFRESVHLDGAYVLESAKEVTIAKRSLFPVPFRVKDPADNTGDGADPAGEDDAGNYRPAGGPIGGGPEHAVRDGPTIPEDGEFSRDARYLDTEAYSSEWKPNLAFHYHERDYHLPDRAVPEAVPKYAALGDRQFLPSPGSEEWKVDERYSAKYYAVNSALRLYEDGSVALRAGCGSEIRIAHGNIEICPAGDVVLRPGRSVVVLAGRDVILRANGSVEASANDGSVRIKGQGDVHVLAGNGGTGSLLLECRSEEGLDVSGFADGTGEDAGPTGGVLVKALGSGLAVVGREVFLSSRSDDGRGQITIDAGAGQHNLVTNCLNGLNYVGNLWAAHAGPVDDVKDTFVVTKDGAELGGQLNVKGILIATSEGYFGGHVRIVNGTVWSDTGDPKVRNLGQLADKVQLVLDDVTIKSDGNNADAAQNFVAYVTLPYYDEGKVGNATAVERVSFSFRSSKGYGAGEDWSLYEAAWQQKARVTGQDLPVWTEHPVPAGGSPTYPYPGLFAWAVQASYATSDPVLWRPDPAGPAPLGSGLYEEPDLPGQDVAAPDGNFTVIG